MPSSSDQTRVGRTLTLGGGADSSLEGRDIEFSVSPKDIRTSPYDLCANRSDRRQCREGDQWFESTSLQRRVHCEPVRFDLSNRLRAETLRSPSGLLQLLCDLAQLALRLRTEAAQSNLLHPVCDRSDQQRRL